ncbi:MAG TPA: glycosyl hydrolase family 28-related protein [Sphingobium sp.]|nr:glycosyl hydrolase family 28-related protein [Sphingobium sp.]
MNRRHHILTTALLAAGTCLASAPAWAGPSVYLTAPDDPKAIVAKAVGDGKADDTAALQAAIDAAASRGAGGILYLPSGRYKITRTLIVAPGTRIFGVGKTRPVLVLPDNTPGFQSGVKNMVVYSGRDPGPANPNFRIASPVQGVVPARDDVADSNPGSFYSAMANVDFEIGKGNPAAAAIRFHAAQHSYLRHMEFNIGSGFAGVYMVGNEAVDLHFKGGRYGIVTEKPSPAWSYTLADSTFEGQRDAGIREHEAGLTLLNVTFRDVPVGVEIDKGYGDWLFGRDVRFENVSKAGVIISNEDNAFTQVSFLDTIASKTPVFARFRDSGKTVGQAGTYKVGEFTYGLTVPGLGKSGDKYEARFAAEGLKALPARGKPYVTPLPPTTEWVSVRTLGAKGDDTTDDTAAIQAAIDKHRVVYLPSGFYKVTDTLRLKPDTVLVGLHPSTTQIRLPDETPGYQGVGAPKALVASAKGGAAMLSGVSLFTGGINPRATALLWKAGEHSLVEDVKIQGGHGTFLPDGTRFNPYDPYHAGDADPRKRWDAQYPSFWVTDGGGGTFTNVWAVNTYAQTGFYISDTETPGRVMQLSAEHHVRREIGLNRVKNWALYAPQTEEEVGEGPDTISLEIQNSSNILVANYHGYRVTRTYKPAHAAAVLENSSDIRFRNVHVNAESGLGACDKKGCGTFLRASKFPYENAIYDRTSQLEVREREFTLLDVPAKPEKPAAQGPQVTKLADRFWSISGGAVDAQGKLYFVEKKFHRIYGWSEDQGLSVERDSPLDPVNLAIDNSGNIIVLSSDGPEGTVYAFKPGTSPEQLTVIPQTPVQARTGAAVAIPVNYWNNGEFKDQYDPATDHFTTLGEMFVRDAAVQNSAEYVSPDGSLVLPAYRTFEQGPPNHLGWRWNNALQTYGFLKAKPGDRVFVTNGSQITTYSGTLGQGGAITDLKPFANRGGESVVQGPDGRVYVANGQVFVYGADGTPAGQIDVPERPLQLLFGGKDGRTLFVLTHHALYSVKP